MAEMVEIGWDALGKMMRKSATAMQRRRNELLDCGVIFFMRHGPRPGRRRVHFFPSIVQRWIIAKTAKGEKI